MLQSTINGETFLLDKIYQYILFVVFTKWWEKHLDIYFTAVPEQWILAIIFILWPSQEQTTLFKANTIEEKSDFSKHLLWEVT